MPLQQLNGTASPRSPAAKRRRAAAQGPAAAVLAQEQHEALAAVRASLQAALAGAPGALGQLQSLQAAVRAALASGEL